MAYPPADPATGFTNDTDQEDSHPDSHNELAVAIADIVDELGSGPKGVFADLTARLTSLVSDVDTKANLLGSTPTGPIVAFATDTTELLFFDGTDWKIGSVRMVTEEENPDAGWTQDNDRLGYGTDYIVGKRLYDVAVGDFTAAVTNGALRVDMSVTPPVLQIYLRQQWNQLFYDLQMTSGDFEHVPVGYTIDVRSGNSNERGLNGLPTVQGYRVDAGAFPFPDILSGGTF